MVQNHRVILDHHQTSLDFLSQNTNYKYEEMSLMFDSVFKFYIQLNLSVKFSIYDII